MPETKKIPRELLAAYFDSFTKRFLRDGSPEAVDIEVASLEWGDQFEVEGARLIGITYDKRTNALELAFDPTLDNRIGDHRIYNPEEVWVLEDERGFPGSLEIVRPDGVREVVSVKHVGLRRLE